MLSLQTNDDFEHMIAKTYRYIDIYICLFLFLEMFIIVMATFSSFQKKTKKLINKKWNKLKQNKTEKKGKKRKKLKMEFRKTEKNSNWVKPKQKIQIKKLKTR